MAFARVIAAAYRRRGMNPDGALRRAQITPQALALPEARLTSLQMEQLSEAAMRELDDEGLGAFSRPLPWGSYGMLARASLTAPDLGIAVKRWCRHHGLIAPDIALALEVEGSRATLAIEEGPGIARHGEAAREFCLVHVLRNIHGLACWYIDSRIPLQGSGFPFAAPAHADAYAHMFPGPRSFGAARATVEFDARYLGLPLRRDERAMRQMLQRALPLTVLQYRHDRLLLQQVRQALAAGAQDADAVATRLNISVRTLHRQLADAGAGLQALKDEVRSERARELLLRTPRPIKQVAQASGFASEKSFMRAFRQWTGMTPAEFRQRG
ncbi:AraC family transcriptional regulator [Ramlibacter aquaticus]|uniref:AraC family transcriptional regulator n=1 Tax=Ramlibacter aquaticus TaxID=2780094 RepID=A0ABR9SJH4_9BURK|nr:AraC family transcriptional regulator [Ramlibacter aquaticus]MBE7942521.1 AraC family transcriptional regulator [Ramlibacter aquaticus]